MTLFQYPCSVHCNGCDEKNHYPHRILEAIEFSVPKERRIVEVFGEKYSPFRTNYFAYCSGLEILVVAIEGRMKAHGFKTALNTLDKSIQDYCTLKNYKTVKNPPLRIVGKVTIIPGSECD